jgi:hypothetical protein
VAQPLAVVLLAALLAPALPAGGPPILTATAPADRADRWRLVPLEAYPSGAPLPLVATPRRSLFVLRAPEGIRTRGFGVALAQVPPGLRVDPGALLDLAARRLGRGAPVFMAATCPPSSPTFSYGCFVLGREPFPDADGRQVEDVALGPDVLLLALEVDGDGPAAGAAPPTLEGMEVGWLDASGGLHRAPVDVGPLAFR